MREKLTLRFLDNDPSATLGAEQSGGLRQARQG